MPPRVVSVRMKEGLAMETRSARLVGGSAPSHGVRRPGTPPAPAGEGAMLVTALGTKVVYQVVPGRLPPGQR